MIGEPLYTIKIEKQSLILKIGQTTQEFPINHDVINLVNEEKYHPFSISIRCEKLVDEKCYLGIESVEIPDLKVSIKITNPWRGSSVRVPTHFQLLTVNNNQENFLSILGLCRSSHGDVCSHDNDCQKTDENLICSSEKSGNHAVCVCIETRPKWHEKLKTCSNQA